MSQFPLCTYLHDDGHQCRSAAVRGRQFCLYHLRYRGRLMRMAQSRALNQRFQLFLPPPEDPAAIHSSISAPRLRAQPASVLLSAAGLVSP